MEKIRVFTAFSGYDSQCLALRRIGVPFELVGWSEIDAFAIKAHNALFPESTDRECFRLMGVDDSDIDTIQASKVSRSQQYKLAGNSIVVDVLAAIFDKMFLHTQSDDIQLKLF